MGSKWAGDYSIVFEEFRKEEFMNTLLLKTQNYHKHINIPPKQKLTSSITLKIKRQRDLTLIEGNLCLPKQNILTNAENHNA